MNAAFAVVVDKLEVKTSVTIHIKMTASGSTFTVVHSHHLWNSWIQAHGAAYQLGTIVFNGVYLQVTASNV